MTAVHVETSDLTGTTTGWVGSAPAQSGAPPIATPAVDAISAAAYTALADWPAAHEQRTGERSIDATKLAAANDATTGILSATDGDDAALIEQSVEV